MESNFHLETSQKNQEYHINLHGIFDGASAFELLGAIHDGAKKGLTMFIDTSHLDEALPFGQAILELNLPKNGMRDKLHFKGTQAGDILPKGCHLLTKEHKCTGDCKNCQCRQVKNHIS